MMQIWGFGKEEISRAVGILRDEKKYLDHKDAVEKVQTKRASKKIAAQEFWDLFGKATQKLAAERGASWHLDWHNYAWGRIPIRLCTIKGHATTHRRNRDQKIPHAVYWPDGIIPEVGIEFANS